MNVKWIFIYMTILLCNVVKCELLEYFRSIGKYFGYDKPQPQPLDDDILAHSIPYEVAVADEKFISEAAKLTGVALSELDSCQHRVVLKLQTTCDRMNDEQLAKMAVTLLNCQSAVEGRKLYPCTDTMSIKDCTSSMDADTWNSYHLISNRARAVCYSVRQTQFRGLTEYTVNKLMDAARNQLHSLNKIAEEQEDLHDMAQQTLKSVAEGQDYLAQQQKDMQMAQLHGQLVLEDNIKRLADEKRLILETHQQLTQMTKSVQGKLEQASSQLEKHTGESRVNHKELLDDLANIQNKAHVIFQRIEDSSKLLLEQSDLAHQQYQVTLAQLAEVNATVHALVSLVGGTRKALEERLSWLNAALGGTDLAVERLYAIVWHMGFLLVGMISCAFLSAQTITKFIIAASPPLNLVLTLYQSPHALDPIGLSAAVGGLVLVQTLFSSVLFLWHKKIPQQAVFWIEQKLTPQKSTAETEGSKRSPYVSSTNSTPSHRHTETYEYKSSHTAREIFEEDEEKDSFDVTSPFSPPTRNGYTSLSRSRTPLSINKEPCGATTRMGTPCKLMALPGRDFCHRHQSGSSIYAG